MFKKLINKFRKKKDSNGRIKKLTELNQTLYPVDNLKVVYEEITTYTSKGYTYKLGDKVIARSNECDPLTIGTIVEFWDNKGKWSNPIPQIKDEVDGKVLCHFGQLKPYSDELLEILKPMRPLEQWNYLLPDNMKEYSYPEKDMDRKEKQYKRVQERKAKNKAKNKDS